MQDQLTQILKTRFKFSKFRPGQREAITTLLETNRLLCIQPTGHGKSLLYQLPAVMLEGITLVISPLLALIRDQVTQLRERFLIPAASINSDQTSDDNYKIKRDVSAGRLKILFVSPEQLDNATQFEFLLQLPISLIVIDEAHCISTWGHDFRPSYRQIIHLISAFEKRNPALKILALTATANAKTEADIKNQLSLSNSAIPVHRESMNRPNIHLRAFKCLNSAEKLYYLSELMKQLKGNGLIYCATRDNTRLASDYLKTQKIKAAAYHAGLDSDVKQKLQKEFTTGKYKVIAATNALGMGIDKSDLRFVIHFDMPGSITAYYQEVGRCGRDGLSASGILLFHDEDRRIQEYFISSAQPTTENFQKILQLITQSKKPLRLMDIKQQTGLHPTIVSVVVAELVEQAFLTKQSNSQSHVYLATSKSTLPNLTRYKNQFEMRHQELDAMKQFSQSKKQCRMKTLRIALGDSHADDCRQCDNCDSSVGSLTIKKEKMTAIQAWIKAR